MDDTALHVRAFRARHHAADANGLARCQAAQQQLLDGELEAALAPLVGDDEVVIVRRLQLRVALDPARSDRDNARRWSDGLGLALARALQHAPAGELLRFANRRRALQAFIADAIAGSSVRDWAWQRLGWLPAGAGVATAARRDALLRWLADDDEASVPLLRSLLGTASWPALVAQLADAELRGLATSVLARIGNDPRAAFGAVLPANAVFATSADAHGVPMADWPAAARTAWQAAATPQRRCWALRLAWMLDDPPLARRGAAAVDAAVAQSLVVDAGGLAADGGDVAQASAPQPGGSGTGGGPTRRRPRGHGALHGDRANAEHSTTASSLPNEQTGWTSFGGLLLLLPLLPRCDALPLLEDPAVWPGANLPSALHRLALQLQPLPADDPAALAFCGLQPGAPPPASSQPPTPQQLAALQQAQTRLTTLLNAALPAWQGPGLIDRIARRRARIVAEPGWVDVHFALRDVSLDLRRAALDLDPGFIPWLGLVLRYRYE